MELNGLNDDSVKESRKKNGINSVDYKNKNSFISLLIESLGDPIIKILLIALAVKVTLLFQNFDWYETLGILIAIFLASFISSISEYGSEKAFMKLQEENMNINVKVKRNGILINIKITEVVVDDIVYLENGDMVPADGIIKKGNILLDESALNGETREVSKHIDDVILKGSIVSDGNCYIKVSAVGKNTMYGTIESEINSKTIVSPLKVRLHHLARVISRIGYIGSILVVISYLFSVIILKNNYDMILIVDTITNPKIMIDYLIYSLTLCVTVIIVAVPEGLPMMVALVLSSNMKKMLKDNVLVRKMVGIETAGNINILFTDKTGTITSGNLNVKKLLNYQGEVCVNSKYNKSFIDSLLYNNLSEYSNNESIGGNNTDKAVMNYLKLTKQDEYEYVINFSSKNKYSVIQMVKDNIYYFKGANEVIINNCEYYLDEKGNRQILKDKNELFKIVNILTKQGYRIISSALKYRNYELTSLIFIGFVVIKDEIRENAIEGIELVHSAGIQTVMITGDDKNTALCIGKDVGLIKKNSDIVLTSDELNNMSDYSISLIIKDLRIVARAKPTDKSRLVRICQDNKLVVGMTGDGVNDAPALKCADVGFAMGSGTSIAKESSDIVIMDNNLISIGKAVLYGRTIFKSIRKFIIYQLTVNCCALILSIIGPLIGISTPITVIQMLWINMIMDTLAGLAFSYEAPLDEYMKELPKKKNESIINKYMYAEIIITGVYSSFVSLFYLYSDYVKGLFRNDIDDLYYMTGFFALFIFMGIFNAINSRTTRINLFSNLRKNKAFIIIFMCISLIQVFLIYYGGSIFRTYGLSFKELLFVFVMAFTVIPVDIIRKMLFKRRNVKNYI